jgi:hypothetical protein
MDRHFGTADAYSHYLRPLGVHAHEVIANCEPLQAAWAREHGFRPTWRLRRLAPGEQLVAAQADAYEADVVYLQNVGYLSPRAHGQLGRRRLLAGQLASEAPPSIQLEPLDLVLTSFPHFVGRLPVHTEYFRIGFDPRVLDRIEPAEVPAGVAFVGSLGRGQHGRGMDVLAAAAERVELDVWGTGVDEWASDSPIRRRHRGEAWGIDMYGVLAGARIALNRHIDVAEDYANNMRLYEATGVGTLLLTDAKRNLGELFEVGREVVAYEGAGDLVDRVRHYLQHEDERAAIAAAGQRRTLDEHCYARRMEELTTILVRRAG